MSRGSGAGRTLQSATVFKLSEVARLQHLWLRAVFPHKSGKFTISLSVSLSLSIYIIYIYMHVQWRMFLLYRLIKSNVQISSHLILSTYDLYILYLVGGFKQLENMKVRLDYHPNYWGKEDMFQTTNQMLYKLYKSQQKPATYILSTSHLSG
jgi:hypothetical protein